ncbi:MAG: hypothetical protein AAF658_00535 [Myxococcota bacterium]
MRKTGWVLKRFWMHTLCFVLIGCGGSDSSVGGDSSGSGSSDATPDDFVFVDQSDVALGEVITSNTVSITGINTSASISVTDGEYSIDGGAFTSAAGTINNNQTVAVRHTSSASINTSTNTTLSVGNVSDTFTSTTADAAGMTGSWSEPEVLDDLSNNADVPNIAVDGAGNVWAVWSQFRDAPSGRSIFARRLDNATGLWGNISTLDDEMESYAFPRLAVNDAGEALVTWNDPNSPGIGTTNTAIWYNGYEPNTGWAGSEVISGGTSSSIGSPHVALDDTGKGIFVWSQWDGTRVSVRSRIYQFGGGWTPTLGNGATWLEPDTNNGTSRFAKVILNEVGNALVVWEQDAGPTSSFEVKRFFATTDTWEMGQSELESVANTGEPDLIEYANGSILVAWAEMGNNGLESIAYSGDLTTFSAVANVEQGSGAAFLPKLATNSLGTVVAAWQQVPNGGSFFQVFVSEYDAGLNSWSPAEMVSDESMGSGLAPKIVIDHAGTITVVWENEFGANNRRLMYSRRPDGGDWSAPQNLEASVNQAGAVGATALAIDDDGNITLVWQQRDGLGAADPYNLWVRRFEL